MIFHERVECSSLSKYLHILDRIHRFEIKDESKIILLRLLINYVIQHHFSHPHSRTYST